MGNDAWSKREHERFLFLRITNDSGTWLDFYDEYQNCIGYPGVLRSSSSLENKRSGIEEEFDGITDSEIHALDHTSHQTGISYADELPDDQETYRRTKWKNQWRGIDQEAEIDLVEIVHRNKELTESEMQLYLSKVFDRSPSAVKICYNRMADELDIPKWDHVFKSLDPGKVDARGDGESDQAEHTDDEGNEDDNDCEPDDHTDSGQQIPSNISIRTSVEVSAPVIRGSLVVIAASLVWIAYLLHHIVF